MTKSVLSVALIQQKVGVNHQENLARTVAAIQTAHQKDAELILLQELHTGHYFCQYQDPRYFDWAETIPGATTQTLRELAKNLGLVIVSSLFEKRANGIYHNTAAVIDRDGEIKGIYRKMHIPDNPGFMEKFYFTPGDLGFTPIKTSIANLGVLICWDQWYPEAARLMAMAGCDLLLYPTAIGWDPHDDTAEKERQRQAWITIQRSHAIANGIPVLSCNRTGYEVNPKQPDTGIEFWGSSFVAGPQGEILAQASTNEEEILITEIDLNRSEQVRRIWPFFRDRRIDAYDNLLERYLT